MGLCDKVWYAQIVNALLGFVVTFHGIRFYGNGNPPAI